MLLFRIEITVLIFRLMSVRGGRRTGTERDT